MEGATEALRSFKEAGHTIVVFTVRGGDDGRRHVKEWMHYYHLPYDYVTNVKLPADWYIDDRAIHFTNWTQASRRVFRNDPEA